MTEIAEPVPATGMFENYRPIPGAFDELFDPSGKPREHSRRLIEELERLGGDAALLAQNPLLFPDEETRRRLFFWGGLDSTAAEQDLDDRFAAMAGTA